MTDRGSGRERKLDGRQEAHPDRLCVQRSAAQGSHALDTPVVGGQGGGVGVCREHLPGDGAPEMLKKTNSEPLVRRKSGVSPSL